MSNVKFILPPGVRMPTLDAQKPDPAPSTEGVSIENRGRQLPTPTGYKLLCVAPDAEQTFQGSSIIKADASIRAEEQATTILFVVAVGPDAYSDKGKFPSGPWCKQGDFVLVRTYSGTRFKVHGKEFRLLNDDQVEAVVDDPRGITRVEA